MANLVGNKSAKKYLRQIRSLFPIYGKPEKKFISDIEISVQGFVNDDPGCTVQELYERYGEPAEIVQNYFESVDADRLYRRLKISKWVRRIAIIVVLLVFIGTCIKGGSVYLEFLKGKDEHVHVIEETIIEEE